MVFLRSNLERSKFFQVFEVFIAKVKKVCLQLFLESQLGLLLCDNIKIILFGSLKNLTKFKYLQHLLCEHDKLLSQYRKLKKVWTNRAVSRT